MPGAVENAKGVVSIVRDGLITIILILLLIAPTTIKASLTDAGFRKGNFGGLEWQAELKDNVKANSDKLVEADTTIGSLQEQLTKTQDALKESEQARTKLANQVTAEMPGTTAADIAVSAPTPETKDIVAENRTILNQSVANRRTFSRQIQVNNELLSKVVRPNGN